MIHSVSKSLKKVSFYNILCKVHKMIFVFLRQKNNIYAGFIELTWQMCTIMAGKFLFEKVDWISFLDKKLQIPIFQNKWGTYLGNKVDVTLALEFPTLDMFEQSEMFALL